MSTNMFIPLSCTVRRCGIYSDAESGRDCTYGTSQMTVLGPVEKKLRL